MTRDIRKEPDAWGNERDVIYENDKKVGVIKEEKTAFLGTPIRVEYDNDHEKVSETRTEHTWYGEKVERTYDPTGRRVSETRHGATAFLGEPRDRTYASDGSLLSEARYAVDFWGTRFKRIIPVRNRRKGSTNSTYGPQGAAASRGSWVDLLLVGYTAVSVALWVVIFAVQALRATGLMSSATVAALNAWLESTVKTPVGFVLLLIFSVGFIVVGLAILVFALAVLFPLAIVERIVRFSLRSEQPWPIIGTAGGIAALFLYFRWLARRVR